MSATTPRGSASRGQPYGELAADEESLEVGDDEEQQAATTIQSVVRGRQMRRRIKELTQKQQRGPWCCCCRQGNASFNAAQDTLAPSWFEHPAFAHLERRSVAAPVYVLLACAPFLTSAGSVMELVYDCPAVSESSTMLFSAGTFSFALVWIAVFHGLRDVVRGASQNTATLQGITRAEAVEEARTELQQQLTSQGSPRPTGMSQDQPEAKSRKPRTLTNASEYIDAGPLFGTQIHVRGIGVHGYDGTAEGVGDYENKSAVKKIFRQFGTVVDVFIRHRTQLETSVPDAKVASKKSWAILRDVALSEATEDEQPRSRNTSWAIVTMGSAKEAQAALETDDPVLAGSTRLVLSKYDTAIALNAKGEMKAYMDAVVVKARLNEKDMSRTTKHLVERYRENNLEINVQQSLQREYNMRTAGNPIVEKPMIMIRNIGMEGWDGTEEGRGKYESEHGVRRVMSALGHTVSTGVEKIQLRHKVRVTSLEDGSTQLQNRSYALVTLESEHALDVTLAVQEMKAGETVLDVQRYDPHKREKSTGSMASMAHSTVGMHGGAFTKLAFAGGLAIERVVVTPQTHQKITRWLHWSGLMSVVLLGVVIGMGVGVGELLASDFDMERGLGNTNGTVSDVFVKGAEFVFFHAPSGCVPDGIMKAYAWLLLLVWLPAALIASLVWPLWILSLQLAVVLAADNVDDVMRMLEPDKVVRLFIASSHSLNEHDEEKEKTGLTEVEARDNWNNEVSMPGGLLVSTMGQLSAWGSAMGASILGCVCVSLGMLPTAVALGNTALIGVLIGITAVPLTIAYAPAELSSSCDDLLDQLCEISFLGRAPAAMKHRERCMQFRWSLTNLNNSQGLGFLIGGTVVDRRFLVKVVIGLGGTLGSVVTTLVSMGGHGTIEAQLAAGSDFGDLVEE